MPLDLQGHSGCLVGWGCDPLSGYWFHVSVHLGHSIWQPLTWKQWPWIQTLDEFIQLGTKACTRKQGYKWAYSNHVFSTVSQKSFIFHQRIPLQMWGYFLPGKKVCTSLLKPPGWQFKEWSWTATAPHCWTRPLGSCHFFLKPPRHARKCDLSQGCWMDWWAHLSHNLSCMQ